MRAFVAIEFPDEIVKEVARVQELLGKRKFVGKMTELENLHLTLKFLGEIDGKKVEEVRRKLREIKFGEMELHIGKVGLFSYRENPRIVWLKIEGKKIWELQKRVDDALEGLFKREERFMSHLTVARVKYVKDRDGFRNFVEGIGIKKIEFKIKEFYLKESELKPLGPVYMDVERYVLEV